MTEERKQDTVRKKPLIKVIAGLLIFVMLLCCILSVLSRAFLPNEHFVDHQQHWYYHFPKNTVDVLCTGNSTFRQGFSPNVVWHDYGIVAYTRPDSRQCPEMTYFEVADTLKRHDLKVVIMGVSRLFYEYDYKENEPLIRRSLDYKHFTFGKIPVAAAISSHSELSETLSYIFPLIRYHSRWQDIELEDVKEMFHHERDYWRGEYRVLELEVLKPRKFADTSKEVPEYSTEAIKWYIKAIELCKKKGVKVLLVTMPEVTNTIGMTEGVQRFADKYGVDYLDFDTDELKEATGLKFEEDFQGGHHLAITGSRKVSDYLGQYMLDHYQVPQWQCSDDLKKKLDDDYVLYSEEYEDTVKILQEQLKKYKEKHKNK